MKVKDIDDLDEYLLANKHCQHDCAKIGALTL